MTKNRKSWTKKSLMGIFVLTFFVLIFSFAPKAYAATCTSNGTGNWNTAGTWSCGHVPIAGTDSAVVNGGFTVTVDTAAAAATSLQVGGTSFGSGNGTLAFNAGSQLTLSGGVTIGNGTRTGSINMTSGGVLQIGTTVTITTVGTWTRGTGTVVYSGAAQNVGDASFFTSYNNLTLSGSGTKTLSASVTSISGNLTTSGTAAATAVVGLTIGGTVTLGSGTAFTAGSFTHNVAGDWTNNGGTFTPSTSTINFNGSNAANINGSATTPFYNLTINKGAAGTTVTSSGKAFSVGNNLTVTQGNLILQATDANYTVTNDLTISTNGTLTHSVDWDTAGKLLSIGGNIAIDGIFTYNNGRSHVQMNSSGTKTVRTGANASSSFSILTILTATTATINASGTLKVDNNFWAGFNSTGISFHTNGFNVTASGSLFNAGGTIYIDGGSLSVTGGFAIGSSANNGAVNFSSGTLTADSVAVGDGTRTGTLTQSGGTANIGNLVISSTGTYTCTDSPAINITGDWTLNTGGTFTPSTSTVTFNGTLAQAINGSSSTTFNNLTINNSTAAVTAGVAFNVNGTLTIISGGILDMSTYALGGTLSTISNSGIIETACLTSALPSGKTWGGEVDYYGAGGQIVIGGSYSSIKTITAGNYTAGGNLSASVILDNGGPSNVAAVLDMLSYTLTATTFGNGGATTKFGGATNGHPATGGGLIVYNGSGQTIGTGSYLGDLTIAETSGNTTLGGNASVAGILTFTSGEIITGANKLTIGSAGSVTGAGAGKYVYGNLDKTFSTGAQSFTFDIGDASNYTPASISFGNITVGGDLTLSTTSGDHPQIASSNVSATKSVNRYWTLANSGITFDNYGAVFNFINPGDLDAGANTANFIVGEYNAGWTYPTVGTETSTSTQATGMTTFGDFQLGEHKDTTPPTVTSVSVQSLTTINVTFSEAMGTGVTTAANYTISESGQGTLAAHPNTVALVSGNTYVLTWSSGALANAADVTITVANAQDLAGNAVGSPNSGIYIIRAIIDFGTIIKEFVAGVKNHFRFH